MNENAKPSEEAKEALKSILSMSDTSLEAAALELDAFVAKKVKEEQERCLSFIAVIRKAFPEPYPDWLLSLVVGDIVMNVPDSQVRE